MTYQGFIKNRDSWLEEIDEDDVAIILNDAFTKASQTGKANILYETEQILIKKRDAFEGRVLSREQINIYEAHYCFSCMLKNLYRY